VTGTGAVGPTTGGAGPGVGGTGAGGVVGVGGTGAGGTGVGGTGAGGAPSTGGSTGTEPLPPKPALITSSNGAFWNTTGTVTMGGTSANITVNTTAAANRQWIGWGGTFNERGWQALQGISQAERDDVMRKLFSKVDGLGLNYGRIPIGASDYAIERYTLCDAPCNETNIDTSFSIEHDKNTAYGLIPYIKAAQAVVNAEKAQYAGIADTKYWGSPWTPPPWMKTGGEMGGYDKGMMRNEPAIRTAYATYFVKWIQGYQAEGIPIDHVYPQNEPGWAQAYPSCAWGPFTDGSTDNSSTQAFLGDFVEDDLLPALTAAGLTTKVWFGTLSNYEWFDEYWGSLGNKSVVGGIGLQWETFNALGTVGTSTTIMQSEHRCGNYPWVSGANNGMTSTAASAEAADSTTFWAPYAPNNYNYGIESWGLLKDWIDGGADGYSAWNMVLDRVGKNLDMARPWPQNALISFNEDGSVNITPYYWVFRHLAQYSDPGGEVLPVTGGDALAFKNPDGSIMVAMYNSGGATQTTLSIGGTMMQFMAPANGWATVNFTPP